MSEVVISNPEYVSPSDTLELVNRLINQEGYCHVPVVEKNKVVGLMTAEDLSARYLRMMEENQPLDTDLAQVQVREVMNRNPLLINEDEKLEEIFDLFLSHDMQGLILINSKKELKGLITSFDLLDYLLAA